MATKYQDSTPQRKTWEVGAVNKPLTYTTWGYDSVLVAFITDENIEAGCIVFEGYLGYKPLDHPEEEWGSWYRISGVDVLTGERVGYYRPWGNDAYLIKTIGFSQFRVREDVPLEGSGKLEVSLACHAVA